MTAVYAVALEPGDKFRWCDEDWYCDEKPQFGIEPGFVWGRAIRATDGLPHDLRIGQAETVERY